MNWRPKSWENPFDEDVRKIIQECKRRGIDSTWHGEAGVGQRAYEAGADAMLEGLKRDSLSRKFVLPVTRKTPPNDLSDLSVTKPGWLVFIPEN